MNSYHKEYNLGKLLQSLGRRCRMAGVLIVGASLGLVACTSHSVKRVNAVDVIQAQQELRQEDLLDVSLVVFEAGIPDDLELREERNIFPEVRRAEARYLPYQLRRTLEASNQWGAARVVPEADPAAEVSVTGRIIKSDGYILEVAITAVDATGRVWFERLYEDTATQFAYRDDVDYPHDPFQDIYSSIANDLYVARQKLNREALRQIRTVADLKYAAELAPQAFGDHLAQNKRGQYQVRRLPAADDPMLRRVHRIRESEYLFVDTVDQQYANFYRQMDPSYDQWRRYSYEETTAMAEIKRSGRARALAGALGVLGGAAVSSSANNRMMSNLGTAGMLGGLAAVKQGYDTYKESKIHEEALKELAVSFDSEVAPIVVEVEGEVVKLNGSLEAQYTEWRRLLRKIYATEVGLPLVEQESHPGVQN